MTEHGCGGEGQPDPDDFVHFPAKISHLFGKPSSATHVAIFATVHDDLAFAYTKMNSTYLPKMDAWRLE